MRQLRIVLVLAVAIILQASLRKVWMPIRYIDFPLIVVVYFALQRDILQALAIGVSAGLAVDFLSGGLLGAGGFSKTLVAYVIASIATRIMLESPLVRILVLAGAALLDSAVYVFLNSMLGLPSLSPFVQTASLGIIGTTVVGTFVLYLLDQLLSERARQRRQFAFRRRIARRSTGILRRK